MWDAIIILGSGFVSPRYDMLDYYGHYRCITAVWLYRFIPVKKIIITGLLMHPKTKRRFANIAANFLCQQGINRNNILIPPVQEPYTTKTDIEQAKEIMRTHHFSKVIIVTEKPHWKYKIKKMFKEKNIKVVFCESVLAPQAYWIKEYFIWSIRTIIHSKKIDSLLKRIWGYLAPKLLGLYVVSRK